jgi:Pectate lyase superfamily protein
MPIETNFLQSGSGAAWRTLSDKVAEVVSVKDFGVAGDGVADDATPLQNLLNTCPWGSTLLFPSGVYRITSTLQITRPVRLLGQNVNQGDHSPPIPTAGARLQATLSAWMINAIPANMAVPMGFAIENMGFVNDAMGGGCIFAREWADARFENLFGIAYRGLHIEGAFGGLVESCKFDGVGNLQHAAGGFGLNVFGHLGLTDIDCAHHDIGIRFSGTGASLIRFRVESCKTGLELSGGPGGTQNLQTSLVKGGYFEACDIAIDDRLQNLGGATDVELTNLFIEGTIGSPSEGSLIGIRMTGTRCAVRHVQVRGCREVALRAAGQMVFEGVLVSRWDSVYSKAWDMATPERMRFIECNYNPLGTSAELSALRDVNIGSRLDFVGQSDYLNGVPAGRNLRRIGMEVTQGSTSLAVVFQSPINNGGPWSAVAGIGGSPGLSGTYYWQTTVVTENGETGPGPVAETKTLTLSGATNKATVVANHDSQAKNFRIRLYRGRTPMTSQVPQNFDGYIESPLYASGASPGFTSFVDEGQALVGLKNPPQETNATDRREPDPFFAVLVTPNWQTTVWVTNKASTGFTLNFDTAAPADAKVDYLIVR